MNSGTGRVGRLVRRFLLAYTSYTEDVKWPTGGKSQTTPCRCAPLRQAAAFMRLLNPVAAKIATTPKTSDYTSIKTAYGACRSSGENHRTGSGRRWQRRRLARGRRSGRGA